jgi:hypothetical protein
VSLWRLEWLRLVRTHRLTGMVAVFLLFGFTGPLTARYLEELLRRFGGGVEVRLPEPVPADGMAAYVDNGQQLGLLVVVLVAAAALAFDAQRESAAFLRTRVRGMWQLVLPKVAVNAGAAVGAFALGALAAWYETAVLLGGLPVAATLAGIAFVAVYLAFAVTPSRRWPPPCCAAWSAPPWPPSRPCCCSAWSSRWASWPTGCPATWSAPCTCSPAAAIPASSCPPPRSPSRSARSRSPPPTGASAAGTCRRRSPPAARLSLDPPTSWGRSAGRGLPGWPEVAGLRVQPLGQAEQCPRGATAQPASEPAGWLVGQHGCVWQGRPGEAVPRVAGSEQGDVVVEHPTLLPTGVSIEDHYGGNRIRRDALPLNR